jgi:hypothetical protein
MSEFQDVTDSLKRALEEAAREAFIAHFEKLGLQFSNLHPTIRAIMERAAISTGDAARQVESFVRLVAMADQYNLTEEQKEYALVKAYEQHGERLVGRRQRSGRGYFAALPDRSIRSPPCRIGLQIRKSRLQRFRSLPATTEAKTRNLRCTSF